MIEKLNLIELIMYPIVLLFTYLIFKKIYSLLENCTTEFGKFPDIIDKLEKPENVTPLLKILIVSGLGLIAIIFFVVIGTLLIEINIMQYEIGTGSIAIINKLLVAYIATLIAAVYILITIYKKE